MMPSPPERPCSERPMAKLASLCDWSNGTSVEELAHRILPSTDVSAGGFSAHRKWSVSGPRGSAHSQRGHVRLLRERSALTKGERELMNGFSSNSRSPSIEKSCKSTGSPTQSVSNDLRKSPAGDSSKDSDEYLGVVLMCQRMSARSRYEISAIQPVKYASDMGSGYMARCPRRLFQHIQGLRQMDDQSMRDEVYHYDSYLAGRPSPCSDLSMDSSRTGSRTDGSSSGGSRCTTSGHRRIEVHLPRLSWRPRVQRAESI